MGNNNSINNNSTDINSSDDIETGSIDNSTNDTTINTATINTITNTTNDIFLPKKITNSVYIVSVDTSELTFEKFKYILDNVEDFDRYTNVIQNVKTEVRYDCSNNDNIVISYNTITFFHEMILNCPKEFLQHFMQKYPKYNVDVLLGCKRTPLHCLVFASANTTYPDYHDKIAILLEHGANPNAPDISGNTPMHLLFRYQNISSDLSLVSLLKSHGGSMDTPNNYMVTPEYIHARYGNSSELKQRYPYCKGTLPRHLEVALYGDF